MNATAQAKLEPGVYSNLREHEYFRIEAVSNSRLSPLLKSPQHCLWQMQHPSEPTAAMTLGSAVDCLMFSPTLFNERFAVAEQCETITKDRGRCSRKGVHAIKDRSIGSGWLCEQHWQSAIKIFTATDLAGREDKSFQVLSPDQSTTAYEMAKAVHDHAGASVLLAACEEFQLSLVWMEMNNYPSGVLCKGRLDGLSTELKTIVDLKTCADASPEAFSRKVADFGYHRQAAMYMRGATFHGIDIKNFVIIAVESEPPHAVALYTLTERGRVQSNIGMIDRVSPVEYGNHQLLRLLDKYEQCERLNHWPGYSEKPEPISLPKWAEMSIERES